MKLKFIYFIILLFFISACGEYNKILKNPDWQVKYEYAKKYFNEGRYSRSATLLEDILVLTKGTSSAEEALYMLAQSYYGMKDYVTASTYFSTYYKTYPRGEYTELSRYYSAYGLYLDSPDPRLDQSQTYAAIKEFQEFLEYYPQSSRKEEVNNIMFELQEKLALKELMAVRLYYNLGSYNPGYPFPGGNYTSCVITAQNALKNYPYSKYREELLYYSVMAKYDMAEQSVDEKKNFRYRDVVDEYFTYINDFPEGRYRKQVEKIYEQASKQVTE